MSSAWTYLVEYSHAPDLAPVALGAFPSPHSAMGYVKRRSGKLQNWTRTEIDGQPHLLTATDGEEFWGITPLPFKPRIEEAE